MPNNYRDNQGRYTLRPPTTEFEETTGQQNPGHRGDHGHHGPLAVGGNLLWGNGGCYVNPMAFPGYQNLYTGTYSTYRWMLQHPILRLVRAIAVADILCNKWEYEGDADTRDDEIKLVQANMDWLRSCLLQDFFVRGRDFGWYSGENVWELRGTTTWLSRVKPLLPDVTYALEDPYGNFSGLLNNVSVSMDIYNPSSTGASGYMPEQPKVKYEPAMRLSAPFKAFKYTYDSESGYCYGRSWLENVRMTAWRDWLDCAQQLQKLGAKITGIQLILTSPAGSFPGPPKTDGTATTIYYRDHCMKLITALANGAPGAWLPALNLGLDSKTNKIDTAKIIAELAQKSVIGCQLLDHGSNTPAIEGILKRMVHNEELMFAGGLKSPRTGMASQHGGKADAEEHTDTGVKISSVEDEDFAKQCQPLVDAILVLNKGVSRKGKVRIHTPKISDSKRAYFKAFLLTAMNDPQIAEELMRVIDINKELRYIDINQNKGASYSPDRVTKAKELANNKGPNSNKQPEPQGGRPQKGGGNPKARPTTAGANGNGRL